MKIVSIEETTFKIESYSQYDGIVITLDDGTSVKMGISNFQQCCESWGYLTSNDNYDEFIGAEYYGMNIVDTALNENTVVELYEGDAMFVNIDTSEGKLQFVAYNDHNGYYGHHAVVVVNNTVVESARL